MLRSIAGGIVVLVVALLVSGCAGNESYPNKPKPPAWLTVSVIVGESDIALSPKPFGAGPTRFVITNQTGTLQKVLFSTEQFDREVPVGSGQTAVLTQTVEAGELSISTSNSAADSVTFTVGPERESSQQDLNQP